MRQRHEPNSEAGASAQDVPVQKPVPQPAPVQPSWPCGVSLTGVQKASFHLPEDLCVVLSAHAFEQLFAYAYATNREISCLGVVKREGNTFFIEKFHLVKQEGGLAHTEMDPAALGTLIENLLTQGKSQEARSLKCWAHSHPGMGVFWSKTDDTTCRLLASDYLISLVVSDGYSVRCRIDASSPVPFVVDNVPVLYEVDHQQERLEQYAKEVAEKVRARPIIPAGTALLPEMGLGFQEEDYWSEYFRQNQGLLDEETEDLGLLEPEDIREELASKREETDVPL